MADEKKRLTSYPEATELQDDDYVMVDNGLTQGTKKYKAKSLGGSTYSETTLYYNSSGAPTSGNITLEDDYTNYNTLIFCVHSLIENNIVTFAYIPTSELNTTVGNYSASTRMTSANMDLQFKVVDSKTLTLSIPNNATKLIKIIGIKY